MAVAGLSLILLLILLPGPERSEAAEEPTPSRLLVTAREFSFTLSRPKLDRGPSMIELYNFGEDPHDLRIQRAGSPRVYSYGETGPGQSTRLTLKLRRASVYRLWCSLEGHAELGMRARLRVSRRKAGFLNPESLTT